MNRTPLIIGTVVLVLLALGGWIVFMNQSTPANNTDLDITIQQQEPANQNATQQPPSTNSADLETIKEFTVTGSNFKFNPAEIRVNQGDTVRITFVNGSGIHDLQIPDLQVATKQITAGEQETIEFVANKAGSFEYFCSVGNHRAMGMTGTLIIE